VQECIQLTIQAATAAPLPFGCSKTIYLCDDGKDREKQEWMKSLGHGYVYVSGRTRAKGETNGKSGNLNNAFAQIYPAELEIPGNECLVIFDADQVFSGSSHCNEFEELATAFPHLLVPAGKSFGGRTTDRPCSPCFDIAILACMRASLELACGNKRDLPRTPGVCRWRVTHFS